MIKLYTMIVSSVYFVKSIPLTLFVGFPKHCIYVTDILKMCMCKFDAKNPLFFFFFFLTKWQYF